MPTSGSAAVNGQELHFEVEGEGDPLVLVMGIGYDSSIWKLHQAAALARHFRVVLFDNRDSGRSSRASGPYTIADMADDVAGLLDTLAVERAHLLGLSMGSMIGQEFALRHPDRLGRLVLCGSGAAPARSAFDPIGIWSWVKTHDTTGEVFAAQQFVWLFSSRFLRDGMAVRQVMALLASNPHPVGADAYARQAQAYERHDVLDRLPGITAPTLVVAGEQDLLTPPWISEEVARAIPGARLEVIPGEGASHLVMLERPEEFNRVVTTFLTNAPAGGNVGVGHEVDETAIASAVSPRSR
ncbi:MAG TPA: alpha/beta fold hydrolase [Longimicrobiales bacterium]|nr:alpha/beta fold hydrolase [Longimicrobiales bacterium]